MINPLPSPPSTNDPSNFATKADALLAALPTFVTEANATAVAMNLNATTDTSASSVAIGAGVKSFTVSTGKSFQPGMWLVVADTAAPSTNQMIGTITSYDTGTGALAMNIVAVLGSGTKTAWVISQSSSGGAIAGPLATSGITGAAESGANNTITSLSGLTTPLSQAQGGTGTATATVLIAQRLVTQFSTPDSGVDTIPLDNTKPQITEGKQYAGKTFTPTDAGSTIVVEVICQAGHSASSAVLIGALFDTLASVPADAVATGVAQNVNNGGISPIVVRYEFVAGSTTARTITFRAGSPTAGTTYVNQSASAATLNSTIFSSMTITEYLP